MEKMGNPKAKPTDQVKKRRGERVVDDPVTGQKVVIKDHSLKGKELEPYRSRISTSRCRFPDSSAARPQVGGRWTRNPSNRL